MSFSDDAVSFFGNTIGQMILILGGIIAGIKYLEKRQDKAMEGKAREIISPYITKICEDINHIRASVKNLRTTVEERSNNVFGELERLDRQSGGVGNRFSGFMNSSSRRRRRYVEEEDEDEEDDDENTR